ncbi:MAG: molybdopterin-dependent oxidoreductase [Hyphomicrobiales bacterium]|nr:molybdopterin-dependent oxidoreductase [Hyphomicrobiales bacterium]
MSEILPSVCPLDCPDTCSLNVSVSEGKIVDIHGSKANPYTDGVICNKVARSYPQMIHGTNRLTSPLRRVGKRGQGKYEEISWKQAIDLVHAGFTQAIDQYGPQSVMPFNYAGPHGELAGGSMDRRFFYQLGATLLNRGPLCGGVRGSAYTSLYGTAPGMPPEQAINSDLIVVWGNNVTVSNLHLIRVIKKAKAQGAKLVVIDPKRTKIAEQSNLFLQIQPGTDVILAMALAAELEKRSALDLTFISKWTVGFEQYMQQARQYTPLDVESKCRLTRLEFESFVDLYLNSTNIATSLGNGIERGRSGGSGLRAAMALQALTGNHGRLGAGVIAKSGLASPKTTDRLQRPDLIPPGTRTFNIVDVGEKLLDRTLDPPIMATMIYNHNPVCTHPDQAKMIRALSREDLFVAGSDVVMTDSMKFADVILPAASHFEYDDIYGAYGQNYIQRAAPVITPVGESLPNTEIFRRLAKRFGFNDPLFSESDLQLMDCAFDNGDKKLDGFQPSRIPLDKALEMQADDGSDAIMCNSALPATPSGKIELYSADLEKRFGYGVPRFEPVEKPFPFTLITPSSPKRTNATFGGCEQSRGPEIVEINTHDASVRSLKNDDIVEVWNDNGNVTLKILVSDDVLQGVLYSPKGTWLNTSATGMTVNALIPSDIRTDIEAGACYHETFVEIKIR